jgi:hypothetical protein
MNSFIMDNKLQNSDMNFHIINEISYELYHNEYFSYTDYLKSHVI